jgi:hypothetical protein
MKNILLTIFISIFIVLISIVSVELFNKSYYLSSIKINHRYIITTDENDNPFEFVDYDTIQIISQKKGWSLYIQNEVDTFSRKTYLLRFLIKDKIK